VLAARSSVKAIEYAGASVAMSVWYEASREDGDPKASGGDTRDGGGYG